MYSLTINAFVETCKAPNVESVTRKDILAFVGTLRDQELADRTLANRSMYLRTFMLRFGVEWPLLPKLDRIDYVEKGCLRVQRRRTPPPVRSSRPGRDGAVHLLPPNRYA